MDIKEEIHALSEEMLTNLGRLVAIDSQLGTPSEGKPFGEGPAKALEEGLKIAEELGFKTVNLDNYCGYAEMGEGDEIVGIAGVEGNGQRELVEAICGMRPIRAGTVRIGGQDSTSLHAKAVNALGVAPHDMIDILKSINAAGALHAEFVVN